jgi:tRNA U34 2-thiouridine synthase MnmA/TrmU
MRKAVVLTSAGLDSTLTIAILKDQGIEPVGLHFRAWFLVPKFRDFEDYPAVQRSMGCIIHYLDISEEYRSILLNPRYGRGSGANPCIDCKLLFLIKARELMREENASFVATGEVLGQRPMSQRQQIMRMLENRSGLEGYLLRPLSAKLLPPTIPEELGWVDRERLYDIQGRSRKRQMQLAHEYGIGEYPSPAGGCLLAEPNFGRRLADLMKYKSSPTTTDLLLLKYGRHFRISENCKLVVGKNQDENGYIERIDWGNVLITPQSTVGPLSRMVWDGNREHLMTALEITARYCSAGSEEAGIVFLVEFGDRQELITYSCRPDSVRIGEMMIR